MPDASCMQNWYFSLRKWTPIQNPSPNSSSVWGRGRRPTDPKSCQLSFPVLSRRHLGLSVTENWQPSHDTHEKPQVQKNDTTCPRSLSNCNTMFLKGYDVLKWQGICSPLSDTFLNFRRKCLMLAGLMEGFLYLTTNYTSPSVLLGFPRQDQKFQLMQIHLRRWPGNFLGTGYVFDHGSLF